MPKDDYVFLDKKMKLSGVKRTYSLGDTIKVKVTASNVFTRKIDFEPVMEKTQKKTPKKIENLCK